MTNTEMTTKIVAATPSLEVGQFAVVALGLDGSTWNTGRIYSTASVAHAQQTRIIGREACNAYVVKRHRAGVTVYLAPATVLGTVA